MNITTKFNPGDHVTMNRPAEGDKAALSFNARIVAIRFQVWFEESTPPEGPGTIECLLEVSNDAMVIARDIYNPRRIGWWDEDLCTAVAQ